MKHMCRWRESAIGRSDELNPALWILVPIRAETPGRLVQMFKNQQRLVTMHDVRVTLIQIPCRQQDPQSGSQDSPGLNLFADNVPANRTCEEAAIPLKYCPFVAEMPMDRPSLKAHAKQIFSAWEKYVYSKVEKYEHFYDDCEALDAEQFELTNATSVQKGQYRILFQRLSQHDTGLAVEASHSRPGIFGYHKDHWLIISASRMTSYAHETCHGRVPLAVRDLCFCRS